MSLRDIIIMVRRTRPIGARLPNRKTLISRYKRSTSIAILPIVELNRPSKQKPAPKNKC